MKVLLLVLGVALGNIFSAGSSRLPETLNHRGLLCIMNETDEIINYEYYWGSKKNWKQVCLRPGASWLHWWDYEGAKCVSPDFHISFDCDMTNGVRYENYQLDRYATYGKECDDAKRYVFERCGPFRVNLFAKRN